MSDVALYLDRPRPWRRLGLELYPGINVIPRARLEALEGDPVLARDRDLGIVQLLDDHEDLRSRLWIERLADAAGALLMLRGGDARASLRHVGALLEQALGDHPDLDATARSRVEQVLDAIDAREAA